MKLPRLALGALLACAPFAAFAASPPFYVDGPTVSPTGFGYSSNSIIRIKRLVLSPTGRLTFGFHLTSNGAGPASAQAGEHIDDSPAKTGPKSSFLYTITVTAAGPNGSSVSNTAIETLHGTTTALVKVPLNVDWAESAIHVSITAATLLCPKQVYVSKLGDWAPDCTGKQTYFVPGEDLSSANLGLSLPLTLPNTAFVLLVTPAAAFQSPVMPVGIVYGPLGNAGKSSFAITQITATNQTISTSQGQTSAYTNDDKTNYSVGLTVGTGNTSSAGKVSAGFNFNGAWDNATESDNSETYGTTGSITSQNQINTTFTTVPGKTPMDQVSYATQPFWQDLILTSINAQYALWDYPAGPVVQPLASADVAVLPVMQLDRCLKTPNAKEPTSLTPVGWKSNQTFVLGTMLVSDDLNHIQVATKAGTSGASAPNWGVNNGDTTTDGTVVWTNEQDHFIPYAGSVNSAVTKYVWLSAKDCSNLASLDQFYANKTQSSHPKAYRLISGGTSIPLSSPTTFSNTDQTAQTVGGTNTLQMTTKVTSSAVNSQDSTYGIDILGVFGISYKESDSPSVTMVATSTDSQTLQKSQSLTGSAAVSTTIQDSYVGSVPVNVMQDSIFVGMAVQDTNMHFPIPMVINHPSSVTARKKTAAPVPQDQATVQENGPVPEVVLPDSFQNLPVVLAAESHAALRKNGSAEPEMYVRRTNYGYVIIQRPSLSEVTLIKDALHTINLEAVKKHTARAIPTVAASPK